MHIPYLTEFLIVAFAHLLAVMSPGPDFALVSRNSLVYTRRAGVLTAIGFGLGILVHVTYSLLGIGLIISKSIFWFSVIKYIGAAYLIYIGWKALKSKPVSNTVKVDTDADSQEGFHALKVGFITNVTNPKATLFFLALFTQVVSPTTPVVVQALYGLEMALMTTVWFSLIAFAFSHQRVKSVLSGVMHYIDRAFGVVLIAIGIRVATSTSK